ncbi:MAG: acid phosphatase [Candidatus Eremiobacteraeota bacterium]|nr:acid phosphatase [Candidatus Eremiobacteraeota bacterium]
MTLALLALLSTHALARTDYTPPLPWPRVDHVVVVVEENKSFGEIVGNPQAPYINLLVRDGALFTRSYGVTHPSLPNYLALFAGITNDNGDGCPATGISARAPNVAAELFGTRRAFAGYAESMPHLGFTGCWYGTYARKHAPWVEFANVPPNASLPFKALPPYDKLPTLAMIVPNVNNDMHDGTIEMGDAWLEKNIAPLLAWGRTHNTLFVLTWDEGYDRDNHIPTIFFGPMVKPGRYARRITHYTVLATLEEVLGVAPTGRAARETPISDCWR